MIKKMYRKSIACTIAILFIGICFVPISGSVEIKKPIEIIGNANGNILYVGGSGGDNYTTIQEAIDASSKDDTVFVLDNSSPYQENIRINKQILVLGENRDTTVINGVDGQDHVVRLSSKNAEISGFTIVGDTEGQDGVTVFPLIEDCTISNNIIKDCSLGIFLQATSVRITISGNTISNNEFQGIILQESDRNVITLNTIEKQGNFGIILEAFSVQNKITNNTIEENFAGIQISGSSSQNTISGNDIINNDMEGIVIGGLLSKTNEITGNNISDNKAGIKISSGGKNTITDNNIMNNNMGIYLSISNDNIIERNNFIKNGRNARFLFSFGNSWDSNYWHNWIGVVFDIQLFKQFPKMIRAIVLRNFDMNPQEEPYDI
jgi:parallel beta-helix repeat protein